MKKLLRLILIFLVFALMAALSAITALACSPEDSNPEANLPDGRILCTGMYRLWDEMHLSN